MRSFKKLSWHKRLKRIGYWFINYKYWPILRAIKTALYWLRTHTYNRYHIINIKSPKQGYKWGWIDRDHALFLAMFRILCDFIEKEVFAYSATPSIAGIKLGHKRALENMKDRMSNGQDVHPMEYDIAKRSYDGLDKLLDLYWWFTNDYEYLRQPQEGDWDYMYKLETQKMKELLELRAHMWT